MGPWPKMLQFDHLAVLARSRQDKAVEYRPNYPLPENYIQGITLTYRRGCIEN